MFPPACSALTAKASQEHVAILHLTHNVEVVPEKDSLVEQAAEWQLKR